MIYPNGPRGTSPGTITVKCLGPTNLVSRRQQGDGIPVRHDEYVWRAPRDLPGPLPHDRSVRFNVYTAADGIRRFVPCPEDGLDGYVARGFQYGHSLLAREHYFDWGRWCEYLVAKHAFDRLEHVQERITRTFQSAESMSIRKALRGLVDHADVLPDDLGQTETGAGRRWSIEKVLSEGRRAAAEAGLANPTAADEVAYGLLAAARLKPLRLADDEALSLIRMSLYDFSLSGSSVSEADREEVWRRLHDLLREHLDEDRERFKDWFMGGNSNLIKSIANRTGGSGPKLSRPVVKRALHDLGWHGYLMVGECVEAFARAFSQALPKPFTPREQHYFEAMYYRQPYLGGLPLALVMERRTLIRPAILQLWENPDDEQLIGALHQVLRYYTEMVPLRREADRVAKQNQAHVTMHKLPESVVEMASGVAADRPSADEMFQVLLERRDVTCPRCQVPPYGRLVGDEFQEGQPFQLDVLCDKHDLIDTLEISWEEVQAIRPQFLDRPRFLPARHSRRRANHATPDRDS